MKNPFETPLLPLPGANFGEGKLMQDTAVAVFESMSQDRARKVAAKLMDNIGISSTAADKNAISMALAAVPDKPMLASNIVQALHESEVTNWNG
jgi:predicted RNA methylase